MKESPHILIISVSSYMFNMIFITTAMRAMIHAIVTQSSSKPVHIGVDGLGH